MTRAFLQQEDAQALAEGLASFTTKCNYGITVKICVESSDTSI